MTCPLIEHRKPFGTSPPTSPPIFPRSEILLRARHFHRRGRETCWPQLEVNPGGKGPSKPAASRQHEEISPAITYWPFLTHTFLSQSHVPLGTPSPSGSHSTLKQPLPGGVSPLQSHRSGAHFVPGGNFLAADSPHAKQTVHVLGVGGGGGDGGGVGAGGGGVGHAFFQSDGGSNLDSKMAFVVKFVKS